MSQEKSAGPKIARTVIHPSVRLREAQIGTQCEVLEDCVLEYCELGDFSYIGERTMIADATIGKFCAMATAHGLAHMLIEGRPALRLDTPGPVGTFMETMLPAVLLATWPD